MYKILGIAFGNTFFITLSIHGMVECKSVFYVVHLTLLKNK